MKKTKTKLKEESNKVPREDWFEQGARKKKSTTSEERSYKREQHKKTREKRQIDRYWIKRLDEENCEKREEILLIKKKNKIRKMTSEEGRAEWSGTRGRKKK